MAKYDKKRKIFIEAYKVSFGNISNACKRTGISRKTYYEWLKKYKSFKSEIENSEPDEMLIDFAESALLKRINSGDTTAIIFTLKTKGKRRGYIERSEIQNDVKIDVITDDDE